MNFSLISRTAKQYGGLTTLKIVNFHSSWCRINGMRV